MPSTFIPTTRLVTFGNVIVVTPEATVAVVLETTVGSAEATVGNDTRNCVALIICETRDPDVILVPLTDLPRTKAAVDETVITSSPEKKEEPVRTSFASLP